MASAREDVAMPTGAALLKGWIARRGLNQVEASVELGFHESFISMLVRGNRMPSLDNALHIEELTGIPVRAWSSRRHDESGLASTTNGRNSKSDKR